MKLKPRVEKIVQKWLRDYGIGFNPTMDRERCIKALERHIYSLIFRLEQERKNNEGD